MSGGPPKYSSNISDGLGQSLKQQTPKEYYQSHGGVSSHRQQYNDRSSYWDGNQWQYYNPSSDYGNQYYQDSYYGRNFDMNVAVSYPYGITNSASSRSFHAGDSMSLTPGLAVHSLSNPNSSLRNQFEQYSRSPKRRRIDMNIAGTDILESASRYNPTAAATAAAATQHLNHSGNFDALGGVSFYDNGISEIEPAPLAAAGEATYGNLNAGLFSPYDHHHQQQQSQLQQSSLLEDIQIPTGNGNGASYYPNTPYHQSTSSSTSDPKLSLSSETGKNSNKVFVTPEHVSSENKLSESNNNQDASSSSASSSHSTEHATRTQSSSSNKSSNSSPGKGGAGTKRAVTDRKQLQSKAWYERFEDLKRYKEQHGNCLVPQKYPPNPSLGIWVNKQRMEYKLLLDNEKSSMSPDRLEALQSIGFVWAKRKGQATWDAKYKQLLEYKANHGDCLIPTKYAKNPALGRWVSTQREHYRMWKQRDPRSKMTVEKAKLLDEIGFVWRLQF